MTTALKIQPHTHVTTEGRDPTRTLTLRNAFARDMGKRFRELRGKVWKAIVVNDVFGLKEENQQLIPTIDLETRVVVITIHQVPPARAFAFPRSRDKIDAFMEWFNREVDDDILEVVERRQLGRPIEAAWTDKYVKQSYETGIKRGRGEMIKAGYGVPTIAATGGISAAFNQVSHLDRAGVLFTRTFNELKGITNAMDQQVSRILADGIAQGLGPAELARQINRTIGSGLGMTDKLGRFIPAERRAKILARTETIRAHHEATIQEYENWKVAGVIVKAEWTTAGDDRVCAQCDELEGQIFTLEEIRGLIPLHPMCRCVALPIEVN